MENVVVLHALNREGILSKKSATRLKCVCKLTWFIITPKSYYPLFKQLGIQSLRNNTFEYVECGLMRTALKHDYSLAVKNNLQNWFKTHDPTKSYMFDTDGPDYGIMSEHCWNGHSGASFGCSMRILEKIFKRGKYAFYFACISI
jgi:hypothetical protein